MRFWLIYLIYCLFINKAICEDINSNKVYIKGFVYSIDSLKIIQNAVISINNIPWCESNTNGYFYLELVHKNQYKISVSCIGYKTVSMDLILKERYTELWFYLDYDIIQFPLIDVYSTYRGWKQQNHTIEISKEKISNILSPVIQDPVRSLESMPVVIVENDMNNRIHIRGGKDDQVHYSIDDIPLFDIYHIGGILSAINPDPLYSIEVKYGGFRGDVGEKMSGTIKFNTQSISNGLNGKIGLGLLSESYFIQTDLLEHQYLHIAYRRTHYNSAGRLIDNSFPYGFNDLVFKWRIHFNKSNFLQITGFNSTDYVTYSGEDSLGNKQQIRWGNKAIGVKDVQILSKLSLESFIYYSKFWNYANVPHVLTNTFNYNQEIGFTQQVSISRPMGINKFGWKYKIFSYDYQWIFIRNTEDMGYLDFGPFMYYDYAFPDEEHQDKQDELYLWSDLEYTINDKYKIYTYIKYYYIIGGDKEFAPSIGLTYNINPQTHFSVIYDRMAQSITKYRDRGKLDIMSLWFIVPEKLMTMDQYSVEFRTEGITGFRFNVSSYMKYYNDIGKATNTGPEIIYGYGEAAGVELSLEKNKNRFQYGIYYTWGRSLTKYASIVNYRKFDKQHSLSLSIDLHIIKNLIIHSSFNFSTGTPYYPWNTKYVGLDDVSFSGVVLVDVTPELSQSMVNSARYPNYHRMDVSIMYSFEVYSQRMNILAGIFNVYNQKNIYQYLSPSSDGSLEGIEGIPFLPNLEVQWEF